MTTAGLSLDYYGGALQKQPALLVTDSNAIHEEEAAPSSTGNRLAIDLAIVKSRATEGEASRLEVDRRTVPDFRLTHQARIEKVRGTASDQ